MVRPEREWIDPDFRQTTGLAGKDFKRVSEYVLKFQGKCGDNQMVNGNTKGMLEPKQNIWTKKFTEKLNFRLGSTA